MVFREFDFQKLSILEKIDYLFGEEDTISGGSVDSVDSADSVAVWAV